MKQADRKKGFKVAAIGFCWARSAFRNSECGLWDWRLFYGAKVVYKCWLKLPHPCACEMFRGYLLINSSCQPGNLMRKVA